MYVPHSSGRKKDHSLELFVEKEVVEAPEIPSVLCVWLHFPVRVERVEITVLELDRVVDGVPDQRLEGLYGLDDGLQMYKKEVVDGVGNHGQGGELGEVLRLEVWEVVVGEGGVQGRQEVE